MVAANHRLLGFAPHPCYVEGGAGFMDSTQATPSTGNFDHTRCGLFRSMCIYGESDGGGALINSRAWNQAVAENRPVGDCRWCGWPVVGYPTEVVGKITWYSAVCTQLGCERVIASPQAEMLRRSSRHSEMPAGFWEQRPGTGKKAY